LAEEEMVLEELTVKITVLEDPVEMEQEIPVVTSASLSSA
jgi:hypothetical protein